MEKESVEEGFGGGRWIGYPDHQLTLAPQPAKYKWANTEAQHPIYIFQWDIKLYHFEKNKMDSMPRRNHTCFVRRRRKS